MTIRTRKQVLGSFMAERVAGRLHTTTTQGENDMPRRNTTPTAPKTKAPTTRADRAATAAARAAVTRAPRSERQPAIDATLSRADEARIVAESRALERGDALHAETKLDRDLAHLADPNAGRRTVLSRRRRDPEEEILVYRGSRIAGPLVAMSITVTVPDEDNAAAVADKQAVIPGLSEDEQRAAHAAACAARGVDTPYRPLADRLVLSGIDYNMGIGKGVLVHEDDVDFLLNHPVHLITRANSDDDEEGASVSPAIAKRNAVAAASQRRAS